MVVPSPHCSSGRARRFCMGRLARHLPHHLPLRQPPPAQGASMCRQHAHRKARECVGVSAWACHACHDSSRAQLYGGGIPAKNQPVQHTPVAPLPQGVHVGRPIRSSDVTIWPPHLAWLWVRRRRTAARWGSSCTTAGGGVTRATGVRLYRGGGGGGGNGSDCGEEGEGGGESTSGLKPGSIWDPCDHTARGPIEI